MFMVRIVVRRLTDDEVEISLEPPPGVHLDRIDGASLRLNGTVAASSWTADPPRRRPSDMFRAFHATFPREAVARSAEGRADGALALTGSLTSGVAISGWCPLPANLRAPRPPASGSSCRVED